MRYLIATLLAALLFVQCTVQQPDDYLLEVIAAAYEAALSAGQIYEEKLIDLKWQAAADLVGFAKQVLMSYYLLQAQVGDVERLQAAALNALAAIDSEWEVFVITDEGTLLLARQQKQELNIGDYFIDEKTKISDLVAKVKSGITKLEHVYVTDVGKTKLYTTLYYFRPWKWIIGIGFSQDTIDYLTAQYTSRLFEHLNQTVQKLSNEDFAIGVLSASGTPIVCPFRSAHATSRPSKIYEFIKRGYSLTRVEVNGTTYRLRIKRTKNFYILLFIREKE